VSTSIALIPTPHASLYKKRMLVSSGARVVQVILFKIYRECLFYFTSMKNNRNKILVNEIFNARRLP